jgi:hypothetical protein
MDRPAFLAVLERVRWHNVARAGAVAGVIALVVLWPRLATPAPDVPPRAAVPVLVGDSPVVAPVVSAAPAATAGRVAEEVPEPTPKPRRSRVRKRPRHRTPRRMREEPRPTRPQAPAVVPRAAFLKPAVVPRPQVPAPPAPPAPSSPPPSPSSREFLPGRHDFTG